MLRATQFFHTIFMKIGDKHLNNQKSPIIIFRPIWSSTVQILYRPNSSKSLRSVENLNKPIRLKHEMISREFQSQMALKIQVSSSLSTYHLSKTFLEYIVINN